MNDNEVFKPTFIDLFSGAGGFSSGFVQAGFQDLLAIEIDHNAAQTYQKNFPSVKVLNEDIRTIHSLDILSHIDSTVLSPTDSAKLSQNDSTSKERIASQKRKSVDVVLVSPPCEPFSAANSRRLKTSWERFYEDPKGDLIFHAIRIIGDLQPKLFVIENVIPMIADEGRELIKEAFKRVGFTKIYFNVISADKYGCPSARNRVFITNFHLQLRQTRWITAGEVLEGLPNPSYPNDYLNHFHVHFAKQVSKKVHKIRQGQAGVFFKGASQEKRNWVRIDPFEIAPVIMGKSRFIHPTEDRPLTVREHARLMGFPDDFEFTGSIETMFNQVGEAVPPIISRQIAEKILRIMS